MKVEFSQGVAERKVGKPEKGGVSRVAYRHIGFLKESHISAEKEIYKIANGNKYTVVMLFFVFYNKIMCNGKHEKSYKEPKLITAVGYRSIQKEEIEQIVVEQCGKVIPNAVSVDVAHYEIVHYIYSKTDYHIACASSEEHLRL